jgi:hypothetical protein
MPDSLNLSPRDVGAGRAIGGAAFLAVVLYFIWHLSKGYTSFGSPVIWAAIILTPVVALGVATTVWRVTMPDEPNPVYGAFAGGLAAGVSVSIFAALIGLVVGITESSADTLGGLVSDLFSFVVFFVAYGGVVTLPLFILVGAAVGYGYERHVARQSD